MYVFWDSIKGYENNERALKEVGVTVCTQAMGYSSVHLIKQLQGFLFSVFFLNANAFACVLDRRII